jgi:glucokinase-like ROK family protein
MAASLDFYIMEAIMGFGRDASAKKYRASITQDHPIWLLQAEQLPNRLFINQAEKELIDRIREHGELTKSNLVSYTDYSRTKISTSINSLLQKHIIVENQASEYTGGRRSKTFSLNGSLGFVAGVDIGATSIDLAVADFSPRILFRSSEESLVRKGPIKVLGRVCSLLEKLFKENGLNSDQLRGIGIGVPGPVDFSTGIAVSPPIMPGWDHYPVIQTVQQWFPSANVVIDNDVNVMALGEMSEGAGKGTTNLIFVKIGTGIGAGIINQGRIYRGANGCAGDIGHISIDKNGPLCSCGNKGCLEALAGGPAMADRALAAALAGKSPVLLKYAERNNGRLTAEDIGNAAREGDGLSIEIIRESGQMIGDVLASLVNFYNPEKIIIGGGVSNIGDLLLSSIRQAVLNRSLPLATRNLNIVFSDTGPDAGVIGAVNLAMDYIFTIEACNGASEKDDE